MNDHVAILKNKKLLFFVVCGTPSSEKVKQAQIIEKNIPQVLQINAEIYFLPGRLTIKLLTVKDRILLKIGAWFEKDPISKKAMTQDIDGVKIENIQSIIKFIQEYVATVVVNEHHQPAL